MSSVVKSHRIDVRENDSEEQAPVRDPLTHFLVEDQGVSEDYAPGGPTQQLSSTTEGDHEQTRGYQEGLALGMSEGVARVEAELGQTLETCKSLLAESMRWKQEQVSQELTNVVDLAVAIAERIVRREVEVDREAIIRVLDDAIRQKEAKDLVRIAVNPEELDTVRAYWSRSHPALNVEIGGDPAIARGGCLLLSQSSLIDALIETQLDVIAREISGEWAMGREGDGRVASEGER